MANNSIASIATTGVSGGYTIIDSSILTTKANTNQINVSGNGADIIIDGKSLKSWMENMEKRLAILSPKPELLAKYEALRQAYDHYKTLEGLLYDGN